LEAIAINLGFNPEGGSKNFSFVTNNTHSELHNFMKVSRGIKRAKDGFFLRAESFYNLATYAEEIGIDFSEYGDKPLHQQSHGESFLNLINNRFRGNGLYLLDEPESALSLQKQLSLMIIINDLVKDNSQFIIATHSPILLAMPNAQIISFDTDSPLRISYEDTRPYEIMSLFLTQKDLMIDSLFNKEE
jgi:predicted ATPase